MPYGGIYLCGGMTLSIKEYLLENKDNLMVLFIKNHYNIRKIMLKKENIYNAFLIKFQFI